MSRASLPETGRDKTELLDVLKGYGQDDADWRGGKAFSLVYHAGDEHLDFLKQAHLVYFSENGLNPMAFKSLKRLEIEVVQMTAAMLHGTSETVGTMTSGGTESILLAVKAARDRARKLKPWIREPEMIVPSTIHVAFDKAAHYFGIKMRYAPVTSALTVDVEAMRKLVSPQTVLIAASAPQYPHGVIDPIAEIGELAEEKGLPFHVDGCVGGFLLPWVEKLGYPIGAFDFRVPGVTSMSADVHKYGYAAKGASVVLYRNMSYLRHQFFVSTDWPGGIYASPTISGTRPGGSIAAAWAAMMALGESGYMELTKKSMEVAAKAKAEIPKIDGLVVLGDPPASIVTFAARDRSELDIYAVGDQLAKKGWTIDRQQKPESIHLTIMPQHAASMDQYLADLREAVAHVRAHPELKSQGNAAMYGMMAKVPFRGMVKESVTKVMESMYGPDALSDLGDVGSKESDGFVLRAMSKYGGTVLGVLDRVDAWRSRLFGNGRR